VSPADGPVKALIDSLADCDCELSVHRQFLYVLYTYKERNEWPPNNTGKKRNNLGWDGAGRDDALQQVGAGAVVRCGSFRGQWGQCLRAWCSVLDRASRRGACR
jgi:hypothetical protein